MLLTQDELDSLAATEAAQPSSAKELGSVLQRERIAMLAERCVKACSGDVIEIGVLTGGTSRHLAPLALQHGRRFIAVDNWPTDIVNHSHYRLDLCEKAFHETIAPWKECVDVWREDIHSPETLRKIAGGSYCFAFSDDGHKYEDHMAELRALLPVTAGLVCVDDVYLPDVVRAVNDSLEAHPEWEALWGSGLRECWLKRK